MLGLSFMMHDLLPMPYYPGVIVYVYSKYSVAPLKHYV